MKRGMAGGAYRGPVAPTRQRRTIRLVQILLLVIAAGLVWFAFADNDTHTQASETIVSLIIAVVCLAAAWSLSDGPSVRVPTPARLDELAGRAESVALDKAAE